MGGSRKGERRGGANPNRAPRASKQQSPRKPSARPAADREPKAADTGTQIVVNSQRKLSQEKERELYFLATGNRARLPKDVMAHAQTYFEETAFEWMQVYAANTRAAQQTDISPAQKLAFEQAAAVAETQIQKYLLMTVDVSFKLAPFIHPKFSAVVLANPADTPINAVQQLIKDIGARAAPRLARYIDIDHDPAEKPQPAKNNN